MGSIGGKGWCTGLAVATDTVSSSEAHVSVSESQLKVVLVAALLSVLPLKRLFVDALLRASDDAIEAGLLVGIPFADEVEGGVMVDWLLVNLVCVPLPFGDELAWNAAGFVCVDGTGGGVFFCCGLGPLIGPEEMMVYPTRTQALKSFLGISALRMEHAK